MHWLVEHKVSLWLIIINTRLENESRWKIWNDAPESEINGQFRRQDHLG